MRNEPRWAPALTRSEAPALPGSGRWRRGEQTLHGVSNCPPQRRPRPAAEAKFLAQRASLAGCCILGHLRIRTGLHAKVPDPGRCARAAPSPRIQRRQDGLPSALWQPPLIHTLKPPRRTIGSRTLLRLCSVSVCAQAIAVSPILADPDMNNCAEQMHDSHLSGRIRPLDQSEVVWTVRCSGPDRSESGRLQ